MNRLGAGGAAGADGDKDVHTAAARVDQAGVQFDEFADADGAIEVEVTDGRGHAVAAAPVGGGGEGRVIDPFEQCATVDEPVDADICRHDTVAVDCLVAARVRWAARRGGPG